MTGPDEPLDLPERAVFWQWVGESVRPVVGYVLVALGALALLLGWYGVSGESLTSKQLPYLVSGGLTGIALIVVAAAYLATEDIRRQLHRVDDLERKVGELHALFAVELATPSAPSAVPMSTLPTAVAVATDSDGDDEQVVALPNGSSYHRPTCQLAAGKSGAVVMDAAAVRDRGLRACRVCDPDPVVTTGR